MLPRMVEAATQQVTVKLEQVDSNGILPLRATAQVFPTAYAFRRFLQKNPIPHLAEFPKAEPLQGVSLPKIDRLPQQITTRWPVASGSLLSGEPSALGRLPSDHSVAAVPCRGGPIAGQALIDRFLDERLQGYAEKRNEPEAAATSMIP